MLTFVILATLLAIAAAAVVVVPLIRRSDDLSRAPWAALIAGVLVVLGSAGIYVSLSEWSWRPAPAEMTPQSMVAQLVRRLASRPDDLDGWLQLGRSYVVLQQIPLAIRAYQRADRLASGRSVEALTGLAEALALQNPEEIQGRAGRLIESALSIDPGNPKALYYGALAALNANDLPLARQRFVALLAQGPPENIRPILERQIAALDAQLAGPNAAQAPPVDQPVVRVRVSLDPSLNAKAGVSAPMFVFVRASGERGPPLAAKRLASQLPQEVELTAADSMLAGRSFDMGQKVEVVARIALSGKPTGESGDPYGKAIYTVGQTQPLNLVIDHLMP